MAMTPEEEKAPSTAPASMLLHSIPTWLMKKIEIKLLEYLNKDDALASLEQDSFGDYWSEISETDIQTIIITFNPSYGEKEKEKEKEKCTAIENLKKLAEKSEAVFGLETRTGEGWTECALKIKSENALDIIKEAIDSPEEQDSPGEETVLPKETAPGCSIC